MDKWKIYEEQRQQIKNLIERGLIPPEEYENQIKKLVERLGI